MHYKAASSRDQHDLVASSPELSSRPKQWAHLKNCQKQGEEEFVAPSFPSDQRFTPGALTPPHSPVASTWALSRSASTGKPQDGS